jgi:tetratricopeptide (TPR) repeat protein
VATAALRAGDVETAWATYEKVLASDPAGAGYWLEIGSALAQRKDYPRAIEALRLATAGEAERGRASYNLACVLALTGERAGALDAVERAVSVGFGNRALYRQDDDLASLRGDPRFEALVARLPA